MFWKVESGKQRKQKGGGCDIWTWVYVCGGEKSREKKKRIKKKKKPLDDRKKEKKKKKKQFRNFITIFSQ